MRNLKLRLSISYFSSCPDKNDRGGSVGIIHAGRGRGISRSNAYVDRKHLEMDASAHFDFIALPAFAQSSTPAQDIVISLLTDLQFSCPNMLHNVSP